MSLRTTFLLQLALKAANCSRTAFASFLFRDEFFLSYTDGSAKGRRGGETAKCKLAMRVWWIAVCVSWC